MPKYKIARIASDIQRYLGEILINEVNDEILKSITITGCDVTNDLSYCKIYFTSIMNMDEKSLEKEVNEAAPFIRGKLSERLEIRHTPELKFIFDKSIAYGEKIEKIIDELERCTNYGTYSWFLVKLDFGLSEKNTLLSLPSINSNTNFIEYKTSKGTIKYDVNKDYTQDFSIFNIDKFEQLRIKDNILIIKYPSCSSNYAPNIKDIKRILNTNNITDVLLDLRGNTGGNSTLIKPLIRFLKHSKLNLTTLVDRYVFSSGRFALIDIKKIGSKIVGEEIGTPINCFGYTSGNDITPNTNLKFNFAKVYWYQDIKTNTMKGIYTKKKLHNQMIFLIQNI